MTWVTQFERKIKNTVTLNLVHPLDLTTQDTITMTR